MSGHNKWSQIKVRKGAQDAKKSAVFSKLLSAITIAARPDPNPITNPRLRTLIEKAKASAVPLANINRAILRQQEKTLEEFTLEAYGPEGIAIVVRAITDSSNRTNQELRKIVLEHSGKVADPGSVLWAFEKTSDQEWHPKFPQSISESAKAALQSLITALTEHPDVQSVTHNAQIQNTNLPMGTNATNGY